MHVCHGNKECQSEGKGQSYALGAQITVKYKILHSNQIVSDYNN